MTERGHQEHAAGSPLGVWAYRLCVALVMVVFAAACFHAVGNVWQWGHNGYNGAAFVQAARNSLRFGVVGQVQYYMGLEQPPPEIVYTHHPMLLHAHLVGLFWSFGVHEWLGRLVPAVYSVLSLVMLFVLARRFGGKAVGLGAVVLFALTPLNLIYANMINHEQGGIFWCLFFIHHTLRWLEERRWPWMVAALVGVTMAGQFDWPAYYLAFFVAIHVAAVGLVQWRQERRWPEPWTFVVAFSAVVLANFGGFFAWIASLRGDLEEMGSAFSTRSSQPDGYLERLWERSLDLQGPWLMALLALWAPVSLWRLAKGRAGPIDAVPLFFVLAQTIHSAVFQQAGFIHAYWTFWSGPAIAIGGALVLVTAWRALAEVLPLGKDDAQRRLVLAIAGGAVVLGVLAPFAWQQFRWGFQTGSGSYVAQYDDQYPQALWLRSVGQRHDREKTTYHLHRSLDARIELLYYLDAPHRTRSGLHLPAPGANGQGHVLLVDLEALPRTRRRPLSRLVERHGAIIINGRFVSIDNRSKDNAVQWFELRPQEAVWWWTWLFNSERPPMALTSVAAPLGGTQELLGADVRLTLQKVKGGRGGSDFEWDCPPGLHMSALEVFERHSKGGKVKTVAGVRAGCRQLGQAQVAAQSARFGAQGPAVAVACAPDEVPVGYYGRSGALVDAVGLLCQKPGAKEIRRSVSAGGHGGKPFEVRCPKGSVVMGLRGRDGALLDAVGVACASPLSQKTKSKGDAER